MADDDRSAHTWDHRPPQGRAATSGELLWTIERNGASWSCELRTIPWGVEAQVLANGDLIVGRLCPTREAAIAWALSARAEVIPQD